MAQVRRNIIRFLFVLPAVVLVYAGLSKFNNPSPASDFLVEILAFRTLDGVRVLGLFEVGLAVWLLSGILRSIASYLTAATFTGFAVVHLLASAGEVEIACGCMGNDGWLSTLPTWGWILMNCCLALAACVKFLDVRDSVRSTRNSTEILSRDES